MSNHDRRSLASAPLPRRTRWGRPDAARPEAPRRPLPSADPIVPQLDPPEPMTRLDLAGLLSQAVRRDLAAASLAGGTGGRS